MASKINVGVIGVGRIGRMHVRNLTTQVPDARVVAVADIIEEAAHQVAATYNVPEAYGDPRYIIEHKDIDAVVICSSTDTHAMLIEQAAEAGKHIFCEKPLDLDLARIDQVLAKVDAAGVKLQVGFQRRFDPSFRRARDLIAEGKIGEPHIVRITSRDPGPPPLAYIKVSGGIFLDMTIHDFDMSRFLTGDEAEEVFAVGNVLVDPQIGEVGDIDTAIVTMRFRQGSLVTIDNSRKAVYGYDQRIEVLGSKGMVAVGNKVPDHVLYADDAGIHTAKPVYFFIERYTEAYVAEMQAFIQAIVEDTEPLVTGVDGRMPVVMGYAAKKSLAEGRPVRLEEVDTRK